MWRVKGGRRYKREGVRVESVRVEGRVCACGGFKGGGGREEGEGRIGTSMSPTTLVLLPLAVVSCPSNINVSTSALISWSVSPTPWSSWGGSGNAHVNTRMVTCVSSVEAFDLKMKLNNQSLQLITRPSHNNKFFSFY